MKNQDREELFEMLTGVTKKNSEEMQRGFLVALETTEDTLRKAFSDESSILNNKIEKLESGYQYLSKLVTQK